MFQGDYQLDGDHYGNLELMVPSKMGRIIHLIRDNGTNTDNRPMEKGWSFAERVGTAPYDQVSCMQSNFGAGKSGHMEMIARSNNQAGFDVFGRDDDLHWHGPVAVGLPTAGTVTHPHSDDPNIGVITQPLNTAQPVKAGPPPMATVDGFWLA